MLVALAAALVLSDLPECEHLSELDGHIQSEDGQYENLVHKCWLISPEGAQTIKLSFEHFDVEDGYDMLHVYDGGTTGASRLTPAAGLSGSALPPPLASTGGVVLIEFLSDFSNRAGGFTFAWTASTSSATPSGWCAPRCDPTRQRNEECDEECFNADCAWDSSECSAMCNATSGCRKSQADDGTCDPECFNAACEWDHGDCGCDTELTAPYGTDETNPITTDYDLYVQRCWLIRAQPGKRISLSFQRFDVEQSYDSLRIFDGDSLAAPALHAAAGEAGGFSGLKTADPNAPVADQLQSLTFTSSSDALLLLFTSDWSITESGFAFGWTPYPPPAGMCAYNCTFEKLADHSACDEACMNAACEWDKGACGGAAPCSPGCEAEMIGDGTCNDECNKPSCNYDLRDCECGTVLQSLSGYQTDGTQPGTDYLNNQELCWLIRPKRPNVTSLTLSFARFDTEAGYDTLTVYDGGRSVAADGTAPTLFSGSGTDLPATITSTDGALLLKFHSDDSFTESGFTFGWTAALAGAPVPHGHCARGCTHQMLTNHVCNPPCMNAACGFDGATLGEGGWHGSDCEGTCTPDDAPADAVCYYAQLGDGVCDPQCDVESCDHDYRDCECKNAALVDAGGYVAHGGATADYRNEEHFCWLIRPKAGAASISLSFRRFDVEARFDGLQVFDGAAAHAAMRLHAETHLSGEKHGEELRALRFSSTGGAMLVLFDSDYSITESGFLFGWTSALASEPKLGDEYCATGCNLAMRTNGKCDKACMNAECNWDAPDGVERSECDRECAPGCALAMLDNERCDPSCAVAECNYDFRDCECATVLDTCDGVSDDGSAANAPYDPDESACWLIRPKVAAGTLSRITLHWTRFDTEEGYDFVSVFDGRSRLDAPFNPASAAGAAHGGWSGSSVPPDVTSSGGELLISFRTDATREKYDGFAFSWTCTGLLDLATGADGASPNLLTNAHFLERANPLGAGAQLLPPRGWNITEDGGAEHEGAGHASGAAVPVGDECCKLLPEPGGALLTTSAPGWFAREQLVNLTALGFSPAYLDEDVPAVHVSQRFARMSLGAQVFMHVELLDASRRVIDSWGPDDRHATAFRPWDLDASGAVLPRCREDCALQDAERVWLSKRHTFSDYGAGLRYVRWRDGGRDASAVAGKLGAVLASPVLTVDICDACGACTSCGAHGACGPGGGCVCERGWEGAECATQVPVSTTLCAYNCSGHGTCEAGRCSCDEGYVDTYCRKQDDDVAAPAGLTCEGGSLDSVIDDDGAPGGVAPSAYRRGVYVTAGSYPGAAQAEPASARAVAREGLVVDTWRASYLHAVVGGERPTSALPDPAALPTAPAHNTTSFYVWLVDADAQAAVQLGAPQLSAREPSAVRARTELVAAAGGTFEVLEALLSPRDDAPEDEYLRLPADGTALQLRVSYECLRVGTFALELELPVDGFCSLTWAWQHRCERAQPGGGGGGWLGWLALLGCAALLLYAAHRRGWLRGAEGGGGESWLDAAWGERGPRHSAPGMLRPAQEVATGRLQEARYAAYALWSRVRTARDELTAPGGGGLVGASAALFRAGGDGGGHDDWPHGGGGGGGGYGADDEPLSPYSPRTGGGFRATSAVDDDKPAHVPLGGRRARRRDELDQDDML